MNPDTQPAIIKHPPLHEYYDLQAQGIVFEMGSRKIHTSITGGKHKYQSRLYVNKGETATTTEAKHAWQSP